MKKRLLSAGRILLLLPVLGFLYMGNVFAQTFDYPAYPALDFSIDHMVLDLEIEPDGMALAGQVNYTISARIGGADTLIFNAPHMEIMEVTVDEMQADFRLHNDSLFVAITDSAVAGDRFEAAVNYRTRPVFGVIRNHNGSVWSSHLPLTTRHWLPVIDHPRVTFTTDISLTVPSGYQALASGRRAGQEVLSTDRIRYRYVSERAIPASLLSFAAGKWHMTGENTDEINLYSESGLSSKNINRDRLLTVAGTFIRRVEKRLGLFYPWETLNVVVLDDHHWEEKSYGAGTLYLYLNRGDLMAQLQRGIAAQWFGVYHREERWHDAEGIVLHQVALYHQLADSVVTWKQQDLPYTSTDSFYEVFGVDRWNRWVEGYGRLQDTSFRTAVNGQMGPAMQQGPGIYHWEDYARGWYRASGQPWFSVRDIDMDSSGAETDSVLYRVDYYYDEMESQATLAFSARDSAYEQLVTLPLLQFTPSGVDTLEVTFTGGSDSVRIGLKPTVQTVELLKGDHPELRIEQYKPVPFLLHEVRNEEELQKRIRAARQLGYHAENPDLQLALLDILEKTESPELEAALLTSLSSITRGAAGTEQIFLDALKTDSPVVKLAAVRALRWYSDNETVVRYVRGVALEKESQELFKAAVESLSALFSAESFLSLTERVVEEDSAGVFAMLAISKLPDRGMKGEAVKLASGYLDPASPFPVRSEALKLVVRNVESTELWENHLDLLIADNDPRMRYLAVRYLQQYGAGSSNKDLEARLLDEYDVRVFHQIQSMLNEE
ncbi:MAG: hypothetical protein R3211_11335 [Balneolaceae bacterium]|nr:hypothetical protein [Balneolaceae bacterium]